MKAKEYLRKYQKVMYHFDKISVIINDLYEMRHDKEKTQTYFERILQSDIRYMEKMEENEKWLEMVTIYGRMDPVRDDGEIEYYDSEFRYNEGEIDKYDAMNVREELIEVVRDDKSFGYLFHLLSKEKDNIPTQQEIEKAIAEESITIDKLVNISETISFSDYLTCDDEIKPVLLEYLKQTFAGKSGKGKHYAIMVCALEKMGLINYTDYAKLHRSIIGLFGNIGDVRGFQKYISKEGLSPDARKEYYTNLLTHSKIDEHTHKINEKMSELKSSL